MMDTRQCIREYVEHHLRNRKVQDDDNIFAQGFVSSLFAMQLVLFIEKTFSIQVGSEDLDISNFRSVQALTALVERKRAIAPDVAMASEKQ